MFDSEGAPQGHKREVTRVHDYFEFHSKGVALNVFVLLLILLTVWFLCEWLIRRRAARKGA